jgi:hypothetical protein
MEWAIKNKEYYMVYILYTELNIGIPNSFLYKLPVKRNFTSVQDFLDTSDCVQSNDKYLNDLFMLFKKSKYTKLKDWGNVFGYILNN